MRRGHHDGLRSTIAQDSDTYDIPISTFSARCRIRMPSRSGCDAALMKPAIAFCAMLAAIFWHAATMSAYTAAMKSQAQPSRIHMQL
jgi:hypothetical protein